MARVVETQTITIDPEAAPVANVNLSKNFTLESASILQNTLLPSGKRQVTFVLVYDDAVALQSSFSVETFLLTAGQAPSLNTVMADAQTANIVEFIENSIKDNSIQLTVITFSTAVARVNRFTAISQTFNPAAPITTGIVVAPLGTLLDQHVVNCGSLAKPSSFGGGTVTGVMGIVTHA